MVKLYDIVDTMLADQAGHFSDLFCQAEPFRHICIDGFLTPGSAALALEDFPSFNTKNAVNEFGAIGGKAVETKISDVSDFYKELYECFISQPFLNLMSDITGIPDLLPDPDLFGGGTHENCDGQELDPHVDFNRMEDLSAFRRLNLLIYLNHEWRADWGGSIELHTDPRHPASNKITAFEPLFNRAIVFETSEISWHGFPRIHLPSDKKHLSRKSISIYLYTKTRPAEEIAAPHATFYVQRPISADISPGRSLTPSDFSEIQEAISKRDAWIEHYQKKELSLTEQVVEGQTFLREVLGCLSVPLLGYGLQEGKLDGMYHDRWVGQQLTLSIGLRRPVVSIILRGWVPDETPGGGKLEMRVGDAVVAMALEAGMFSLSANVTAGTERPISLEVASTNWVMPEGPNGRKLVFVLKEIELIHPTLECTAN